MKRTIGLAAVSGALLLSGTAMAQDIEIAHAKKLAAEAASGRVFVQVYDTGFGPASKLVTGAPYAAEEKSVSTQILADGNRIVNTSSAKLYRDQQGRTRIERENDSEKTVMIDDPVSSAHFVLDQNKRTFVKGGAVQLSEAKRTLEVKVKQAAEMKAMGNSTMVFSKVKSDDAKSANVERLNNQVMEGLAVEGTRTTITIPAGEIGNERPIQIVSERWYSPDLQMVIMSKRSDPRMGETVYTVSGINRANPDASLFQVPAGYTETQSVGGTVLHRSLHPEE